MPTEEWEEEFERIVSNMSNNTPRERYEVDVEFERQANLTHLVKEGAQIRYLTALTAAHRAATIAILLASVLGVAWSFYAWFS